MEPVGVGEMLPQPANGDASLLGVEPLAEDVRTERGHRLVFRKQFANPLDRGREVRVRCVGIQRDQQLAVLLASFQTFAELVESIERVDRGIQKVEQRQRGGFVPQNWSCREQEQPTAECAMVRRCS